MEPLFVYYICVVGISSICLFWGLYRLKRAEKNTVLNAKEMGVTEVVETEMLDDDFEHIARKRVIASIEGRFDFIRKTYVPLIGVISLFLLVLPNLPKLSAGYVSLLAGAVTVMLGIAAKPLLENLIAGVVITLSQPFRSGDTIIIDDKYGSVERITMLYSVVKVWNWRRYVIPNHKLLQKEFENLTMNGEMEWTHVEFTVAPGTDLELVKTIAKNAMESRFLLKEEPPSFWIMSFRPDAIVCWVAGWAANPAEAWALKSLARKRIATKFAERGINFQTIHNQVDLVNSKKSFAETSV